MIVNNIFRILLFITGVYCSLAVGSVSPSHSFLSEPSLHDMWSRPVAESFPFGELYEQPAHRYAAGHRGIDFLTTPGVAVYAPTAGTVHFVGTVAEKPVVSIRVNDRILYSFEPVDSDLARGDIVNEGDQIGTVAIGGHCGQHCLHFGVRIDGEYVNPLRFLAERPRLLPVGDM